MPLINQYFKNHCLYFLSTPAKVLGSGGHSSNKEKEMIARWALLLRRNNTQLWQIFCQNFFSFTISFFLTICPHSLVIYFSFPFHHIVSFVKCLLWWDTEFLSLVRHYFLSESFHSFLWLLDCMWAYDVIHCFVRHFQFILSRMHHVMNQISHAGTDASAIVNCLHILARSLDARFSIYCVFCRDLKFVHSC